MIIAGRHSTTFLKAFKLGRRVGTDACGIPLEPTWSVRKLISLYPSPSLSSDTFRRLHELSALTPPTEGTPECNATKNSLDELVKLVEAVKLVHMDRVTDDFIPDGRVWPENTGIPLTKKPLNEGTRQTALLNYSSRTLEGMYVVETDRRRY